jgi:TonB family protein
MPTLSWIYLADGIESTISDQNVDQGVDYWMWMIRCLVAIYALGIAVVLSKMIYGLIKIYKLYKAGDKERKQHYMLVTTQSIHLPFSFFHYVFISRQLPLNDHMQTILDHEEIHIRQWHTLDILFAEVIQAFYWFNPVMIFYKSALRQAHEFLADASICRTKSVSSYTDLLLSKSQSGLELALTNQFFHSQIKKRIKMMTKSKTDTRNVWKYALILPLLIGVIMVFSSSTTTGNIEKTTEIALDTIPKKRNAKVQKPKPKKYVKSISSPADNPDVQIITYNDGTIEKYDLNVKSEHDAYMRKYVTPPPPPPPPPPVPSKKDWEKAARKKGVPPPPPPPPPMEDEIFRVVTEMPRFPGCNTGTDKERDECSKKKLLDYIYTNLKYPKLAKDNGTEGQVVLQFVITRDGSISDVRIVRDIGDGCGEAASEVVKSMNNMSEKWEPGRQGGKKVKVLYTLPVKFKITDDKKK